MHAVSGISLDVLEGETLGLVGESGCGKSTTGRAIMQLPQPTSGSVHFDGQDLTKLSGEQLRRVRPEMQMIFQDPISSLNPRRKVGDIVAEPLDIWGRGESQEADAVVDEMLEAVGLDPRGARPPPAPVLRRPVPAHLHRPGAGARPEGHHLRRAGVGPRRVGAGPDPQPARGHEGPLRAHPGLHRPRPRRGEEHQRPGGGHVPRQAVRGEPADELYAEPAHPYTAALLSSIPVPDPEASSKIEEGVAGELPSPLAPPSGCRFRTRCPRAEDRCAEEEPQMRAVVGSDDHFVACHFPLVEAEAPPAEPSTTEVAIAGAS